MEEAQGDLGISRSLSRGLCRLKVTDFEGREDGPGRPAEGQQKGAEHSRRGGKLTGWASRRLKVDP